MTTLALNSMPTTGNHDTGETLAWSLAIVGRATRGLAEPPTPIVVVIEDLSELTQGTASRLFAILNARHESPLRDRRTETSALGELTKSELRVLRYLPTNLSRPDIARELYVSVNTVNTHVRNIYSKLDAANRAQAVDRARQLQLLAH